MAYAGQVVPSAALIESLWGDDPPRSAAKSLQTYVLRLRNSLEPDRHGQPRLLLTDGAGYQLAISPADTDAGRFSRLADLARQALAGGRPEAAVEASRDALDLWRGTAYAGCEDTAFGQAEARRLDELRLSVVETRMEAHLALGRESAAVPELERRVGDHPLRERLWELLMLAYYRSGQQAPGARNVRPGAQHARRRARRGPRPWSPRDARPDPRAGSDPAAGASPRHRPSRAA